MISNRLLFENALKVLVETSKKYHIPHRSSYYLDRIEEYSKSKLVLIVTQGREIHPDSLLEFADNLPDTFSMDTLELTPEVAEDDSFY